jgi:hypothetical protein
LARRRFAAKTQIIGYWISLDSLVRNEPYQWVTLDFRAKETLASFASAEVSPDKAPAVF